MTSVPVLAQESSDIELLKRLIEGDQTAATALYKQHYQSVYGFVRMQIDDVGAIPEIVDDVFMAVFSSAAQFKGQSAPKTWMLGIARNICHNWLRKMSREPVQQRDALPDELASLVDQQWPVLDRIERDETRDIVRFCMDRLPIQQREALFWVYFEDMSIDETAQVLQCAAGTVKSRLFHAKSKMADCVHRRLAAAVT